VPADVTQEALRSPVEQVEQMILQQIDATFSAGYPGFRMTHQASSALREAGGVSLTEYDAGLDRVLQSRPRARALCFYDRGRYPEHVIERMRALLSLGGATGAAASFQSRAWPAPTTAPMGAMVCCACAVGPWPLRQSPVQCRPLKSPPPPPLIDTNLNGRPIRHDPAVPAIRPWHRACRRTAGGAVAAPGR
ncbi:MAG: MEDS domain-containing protein, partial [Proteobacteria bacterium]|nr:MEDS domain-containing protein [Pseudomonadota bacterium]